MMGMTMEQTTEQKSVREILLEEAKLCVCGCRAEDNGKPEHNFDRIAKLWTAYAGYHFRAEDVAAMMILLKTARIASGSDKMDNWVDAAGYAACGGELLSDRRQRELTEGTV